MKGGPRGEGRGSRGHLPSQDSGSVAGAQAYCRRHSAQHLLSCLSSFSCVGLQRTLCLFVCLIAPLSRISRLPLLWWIFWCARGTLLPKYHSVSRVYAHTQTNGGRVEEGGGASDHRDNGKGRGERAKRQQVRGERTKGGRRRGREKQTRKMNSV